MNTYSSGLCLFCFRPHSNNAGSRCKSCGTSYPAEPKKINYKKWPAKKTLQESDFNVTETNSAE